VFGVTHHKSLKAGLTAQDCEEMRLGIAEALLDVSFNEKKKRRAEKTKTKKKTNASMCVDDEQVASTTAAAATTTTTTTEHGATISCGGGWVLKQCGGARRGRGAGHDADFLLTHPEHCTFSNCSSVLSRVVSIVQFFIFQFLPGASEKSSVISHLNARPSAEFFDREVLSTLYVI